MEIPLPATRQAYAETAESCQAVSVTNEIRLAKTNVEYGATVGIVALRWPIGSHAGCPLHAGASSL